MKIDPKPKQMTVPIVRARKGGAPLVCLTAYTFPEARALDPHCDVLLVGDTLGMVVHGLPTTVGVTLEHMIMHGQAVVRGASHALVVVDLPFGAYEMSPAQAFKSASRVMRETGCAAVKLEGGQVMAETVAFLTARGVPVLGHIGLKPQAVHAMGGYKVVGKRRADWPLVEADARAVADAGAFAVVIEGVAEPLAAKITSEITIPTIGIGASASCDGQILVTYDLLGLTEDAPRFAKRYGDVATVLGKAAAAYAEDVRARRFPSADHVYSVKE